MILCGRQISLILDGLTVVLLSVLVVETIQHDLIFICRVLLEGCQNVCFLCRRVIWIQIKCKNFFILFVKMKALWVFLSLLPVNQQNLLVEFAKSATVTFFQIWFYIFLCIYIFLASLSFSLLLSCLHCVSVWVFSLHLPFYHLRNPLDRSLNICTFDLSYNKLYLVISKIYRLMRNHTDYAKNIYLVGICAFGLPFL